jgi:hypothetical protein
MPITDEAVLGNREQLIDPSAFESEDPAAARAAVSSDPFMGLTLTAECQQVLRYGADVRKTTPRSIIEQVLEDWAARQRAAWAKGSGKG